jgi:hypothetical protein
MIGKKVDVINGLCRLKCRCILREPGDIKI